MPTDRSRRWGVVALLSGLLAANNLDRGNLSVAIPLIMADMHLSHTEAGLVLSAFQWTYALANLPMGFLADRSDPRRLVAWAAIAWTCFAATTGAAPGLVGLIVLRAGLGIAEAPMFPVAIRIAGTWFPERERAAAVSVYELAAQIGYAAAPPLATWAMLWLGWRWMFAAIAIVTLIPLALWLRFLPARNAAHSGESSVPAISLSDWLALVRRPQPWIMFAGSFCLSGAMGFYAWLPLFLERTYGLSIAQAGLAAGAAGAAGLAGIVLGGWSSDRLIRRGFAPLTARRVTVALPSLLMAVVLAAVAVAGPSLGLPLIAFGMLVAGFGMPAWWALVTAVAPSDRFLSSLGGIQNGGAFLGAAAAPVAIGAILDRTGLFTPVLLGAAGLLVVTALCYGLALRAAIPADLGSTSRPS